MELVIVVIGYGTVFIIAGIVVLLVMQQKKRVLAEALNRINRYRERFASENNSEWVKKSDQCIEQIGQAASTEEATRLENDYFDALYTAGLAPELADNL